MSKNSQEKVLEALAGLLPEESQKKVASVVASLLDEAVAALSGDYEAKLAEAVSEVEAKRAEDKEKTELGYKQAYEIIADLRNRLLLQNEESTQKFEEEYEEAYKIIKAEREEKEKIYEEVNKHYNDRLNEMREFMIEMADKFLHDVGAEYLEEARRQVMNDPCFAEQRLALDKILNVCESYISEEGVNYSNSQVKTLREQLEQIESFKRQLEAKNMKLLDENNKMKKYLTETREFIKGSLLTEQNERLAAAKNVEGNGKKFVQPERQVVIGEHVDHTVNESSSNKNTSNMTIADTWRTLAGMK